MKKRKKLDLDTAGFSRAAVPQPDPVEKATTKATVVASPPVPPAKTSRADKVQIQGYFPTEVRRDLKTLAAQQERTLEDMLGEAIVDLLAKYRAR
jgi:hypothetical protein